MTEKMDVIVLGAGAAGLMCAIEAGKRGRSVKLIERAEKIGKKILISGGGRCNFTNIHCSADNFISENSHYCKSALAQFTPRDFIALVEKQGIKYHEKKLGQLFCDQSANEIVGMLNSECRAAGVQIALDCQVSGILKKDLFEVRTNKGDFESESLVVATGGISIPKMGATDFGYQVAEQFGVKVVARRPALVPFTWNRADLAYFQELAGVSIDAIVRCGARKFREQILFTHKGLSGPAILQISSYWKPGDAIVIDLLPGKDVFDELVLGRNQSADVGRTLARYFPRSFVGKWVGKIPAKPQNLYSDKELRAIARSLHEWEVVPADTEGYDKAEVTAGGVSTAECLSQTMECKKVPGLYFIGEVMDVTGHLGGHNFQWAWASGFAAGQRV